MADNTNTTDTSSVSKMDDTRTRKTLKLKPVGEKTENDIKAPVVDPLTMRDTETGPLATMDDTRTRKTVKLKATKDGFAIADTPKADLKPVVDPLTMRNTETGPLGAMVDTRTRKTVKLKPLKTAGDKPGEPIPTAPVAEKTPAVEPEGAPKTLQDTSTRRTLKLKAVKPGEASKATVPEGGNLQDTNTRKTLKLKAVKPGEAPTSGDGNLKDTNTRKTLKLKAVKPGEAPTSGDGNLKDTNTRKTLKLKAVKPGEASTLAPAGGNLQDTNTRKTLKLKAIKPGETKEAGKVPTITPADKKAPTLTPADKKVPTLTPVSTPAAPAPAADNEQDFDDTRTKNVQAIPSKETRGINSAPVANSAVDDDTIKIERPKKKADVMPMPSLGAPAAAKTVNNKETVKLRPSAAIKKDGPGEATTAKASKETIKLSPPGAAKKEEAPVAKAKAEEEEPKKSKLTIGKVPPPKTTPKEDAEAEAPAGGSGLKLKSMAPKIEAPRAAADQEKIKGIKKNKKSGGSQASMFYTAVAVITFVLVAFSALVTTSQFFELWDTENPVGVQIIPIVKDVMKELVKMI